MKKFRNLFFSFASVALLLFGCQPQSSREESSLTTSQDTSSELTAPKQITLTERTLSWEAVDGASSYIVLLNADEHTTYEHYFALPATTYGIITVQVKACHLTSCSPYSEVQTFTAYLTLEVPQNLRQVGNQIFWDEVPLATGYIVKINHASEQYVNHPAYDLTSEVVSLKVLATASDPYLKSSAYSEEITIKQQLDTPRNIAFDDGFLLWDAVAQAREYKVVIDGSLWGMSPTNRCEIGYYQTGMLTVEIQARGDSATYLNSEIAQVEINVPKITLTTPTNLTLTGNILTFAAVPYADGYQIYIDGNLVAGITTNRYTMPQATIEGCVYVQVQAISSANYPSALSEKYYFNVTLINSETELRAMTFLGSYRLNADITLTEPWTPKAFGGRFDGAGHTISGIDVSDQNQNVGFFSCLNGASISNLKLVGLVNSASNQTFEAHIGGLSAVISHATIRNVEVIIDINLHARNGIAKAGGIAGVSDNSIYENVHYQGEITAAYAISGGFIGLLRQSEQGVMISRSSANGTLTATGSEQTPTGGFIGQMLDNYMQIMQAKANMEVTGANYSGGFVGYMGYGGISDCYAEGSVQATATTLVHLGGFVGRMEGYNNLLICCLALSTVIDKTGEDVFVGAFVGVTPGGSHATIYYHCAYDKTQSTMDRIGNSATGKGDGITGYTSDELLSELDYNLEIWDFTGTKPRLQWELT